eukprot:GEMP01110592.1.p1 GENE.GEMP01110592.1~~GEMP01110592.1.p1  ORF type:complete len:131 (+),score=10.82 GEMP01110592.1:261-653(+)
MESPQSTESPQSASHGDTSPPPPKVTRVRGVACHNDRERTFEIPKSACGMDTMSTSPCGEETPSTPRGMVQQEPNHDRHRGGARKEANTHTHTAVSYWGGEGRRVFVSQTKRNKCGVVDGHRGGALSSIL